LSKSDILINEGTTSQISLKNSSRQDCNFEHIILFSIIGFSHIWENQGTFSKSKLLFSVTKQLENRYILNIGLVLDFLDMPEILNCYTLSLINESNK
jgi:hypothetical protein